MYCSNVTVLYLYWLVAVKTKRPYSFKDTASFVFNMPVNYCNEMGMWIYGMILPSIHDSILFLFHRSDSLKQFGIILDNKPSYPKKDILKTDILISKCDFSCSIYGSRSEFLFERHKLTQNHVQNNQIFTISFDWLCNHCLLLFRLLTGLWKIILYHNIYKQILYVANKHISCYVYCL